MGIMKKEQTIKVVLFKYLVSVALGLIVTCILSGILYFILFYFNIILPANYTEQIILNQKSSVSSASTFDKNLLPKDSSYAFLSLNGEVIDTNMSSDLIQKAVAFHNFDFLETAELSFIEIRRVDGSVIVAYSLIPKYAYSWMQIYLPNVNVLFVSIFTLLAFINVCIVTFIYANYLHKKIQIIINASKEISKQNLDFIMKKTDIVEFNYILNALENMKNELSTSLKENWIQTDNKKKQLSALIHDLKTPIAIVNGNVELLKETSLTDNQMMYVDYIEKNAMRITHYSKALIDMSIFESQSIHLQKVNVLKIIERIKEIAKITLLTNHFQIEELNDFENQFINADTDLLDRVFQNIIDNARTYSNEKDMIQLVFEITEEYLYVSVLDQGQGFSKEDLMYASQSFYRGDKSRHSDTHYGLGLYSTKSIIEKHSGKLLLKNRGDVSGAEVIVMLPLLKVTE